MNQEIRKQIVREGLTTLSEFNSPVLWKLYAQDSQLNSLSKKKKEKLQMILLTYCQWKDKEVEKITVVILWFPNCVEGLHETF